MKALVWLLELVTLHGMQAIHWLFLWILAVVLVEKLQYSYIYLFFYYCIIYTLFIFLWYIVKKAIILYMVL